METISGDPHAKAVDEALGYTPHDTADVAKSEAAKANAHVVSPDDMLRRDFARRVVANDRI
jgi:hypothetical protein